MTKTTTPSQEYINFMLGNNNVSNKKKKKEQQQQQQQTKNNKKGKGDNSYNNNNNKVILDDDKNDPNRNNINNNNVVGGRKSIQSNEGYINNNRRTYSTPTTATTVISSNSSNIKKNNNNNKIQSITNSFKSIVIQDIIEIDDKLEQVLQSIVNLRERIYHTSQLIFHIKILSKPSSSSTTTTTTIKMDNNNNNNKMKYLYRSYNNNNNNNNNNNVDNRLLTLNDLQVTLDHDLLQHEKMMLLIRKLVSLMGQGVETLGRRLNELYMISLVIEQPEYYNHYNNNNDDAVIENSNNDDIITTYQTLFAKISKELYRKQILASEMFNSCNDAILFNTTNGDYDSDQIRINNIMEYDTRSGMIRNNNNNNDDCDDTDGNINNNNSRQIAQRCLRRWSRNKKISYLYDSKPLLDDIIKSLSH